MIESKCNSRRIISQEQTPVSSTQVQRGSITGPLDTPPNQMILNTISHLGSPRDLKSLGLTCKFLHQITEHDLAWKIHFQNRFRITYPLISHLPNVGYRNLYKELVTLGNDIFVTATKERNRLYAGANDGMIKVLDVPTGKCLELLNGHKDSVEALLGVLTFLKKIEVAYVTFHGNLILTGSPNLVTAWRIDEDGRASECIGMFRGFKGTVTSIQVFKDHLYVTTSSDDNSHILNIYDMKTATANGGVVEEPLSWEYVGQQPVMVGSQGTCSEEMPLPHTLGVPDEVMLMIFSKMTTSSVATNSLVCKDWNRLNGDNGLWKFFLERDFQKSIIKSENCKLIYKASEQELVSRNLHTIERIKQIFPAMGTESLRTLIPHADAVAYALHFFHQLRTPADKINVFHTILSAVNSTGLIAKQFYDALPVENQNGFKGQMWKDNGSSSVRGGHDHRGGFGDYMVHHEIRSDLAKQAAANYCNALLPGTIPQWK